ncbi:unnamed protein product [Diamesa hyperborea]
MDFIVKRLCKLFIVLWITSKSIAKPRILSRCVFTPHQCPNRNITFFFYTRATKDYPIQLDMYKPTKVLSAQYVKDRPLIVIIHGYTGDHNFAPNYQLRPAFFKEDDFNIISVDYEPLAQEPCYPHAVENLPTVANCTAQLLNFLMDRKIFSLESIHVIGFSLGAQASGMVANYLTKGRKLKRITGLDPAKPLFVRASNDYRLDQNDAEFVDIIHTDVFARGVLLPSGHVDFYANGGGTSQPGCGSSTIFQTLACDHTKVTPYFIESITSKKGFWAGPCTNLFTYLLGWCEPKDKDMVVMGEHCSWKARGVYYVTTNGKPPYARGFPGKNRREARNNGGSDGNQYTGLR